MKKIILILALIFSCGLTAQTKIYEIQNKGKGVISELTPANLLLIKDDSAKIAISNVTGLGDALDLKANNSEVVKLTGNQTIDGYKTFTSTITATTFNDDDFAVNAFSDAGSGVKAASNTSTALRAESVSGPAAIFKTTSGSRIVSFQYGFDDKAYIDTNGGYVKSSVPANNILLAGGGDLAQNTAFNKNFGTASGTVAEGNDSRILNGQTAFSWGNHAGLYPSLTGVGANGTWGINISGNAASATNWGGKNAFLDETAINIGSILVLSAEGSVKTSTTAQIKSFLGLGSNAYTSTAYLPLSGGTVTGPLVLGSTNGSHLAFQADGNNIGLVTNTFNIIGSGTTTDLNTYVYGNNAYNIWTNNGQRLRIGGDGNATFAGTVTATSYTATSLPVFENNAAASSLSVGQFYRTSTGVLMVKF